MTKALRTGDPECPWTKSWSSFTQQFLRTETNTNLLASCDGYFYRKIPHRERIQILASSWRKSQATATTGQRQATEQGKKSENNRGKWDVGKRRLGKGSPQVLVQTVWWLLTQYSWPLRSSETLQHDGRIFHLWTKWMKTTRCSTSNSWITRPKHAGLDYTQSLEASFQKCLLLEVIYIPLQYSNSFCRVVLPKYMQPVHSICLLCQIHPRKFGTSDSRWEWKSSIAWWRP